MWQPRRDAGLRRTPQPRRQVGADLRVDVPALRHRGRARDAMGAGTVSLYELTDLVQGSDEWLDQRRGMVTASVVGQLIAVGSPDPIDAACEGCGAPSGS